MNNIRLCISMSQDDIDKFENGRETANMNRSAYIRLLIAEHENVIPGFYRNKELISELAKLNNGINELLLKNTLSDAEKLKLYEKMTDITKKIKDEKL